MARQEVRQHVLNDVDYPASKAQLVEACEGMSDVPVEDKQWFEETLPDGTYSSADDVLKALGL